MGLERGRVTTKKATHPTGSRWRAHDDADGASSLSQRKNASGKDVGDQTRLRMFLRPRHTSIVRSTPKGLCQTYDKQE
jgi:hypothetical protein